MFKQKNLKLTILVFLFFSFSCMASAPETIQWSYQYGLVTENQRLSISLAKMLIEYADQLDTQRSDVIAELLLTRYGDNEGSRNLIIWYGRLLSATKRKRYVSVLEEVAEQSQSRGVPKEFRSLAKKLKKARSEDEPGYQKGGVNLDLIKKSYIDTALIADLSDKKLDLENLLKKNKRKVSVQMVFDTLGVPQHLRLGGDSTIFGLKFFYYYKGLGRAEFYFSSRHGSFKYKGFDQRALAYELDMPYFSVAKNPADEDLAMKMLLSSESQTTINVLNYYINNDFSPSLDFLDVSAEMLSQFLTGADTGVSDKTYNWVCRMLGVHGKGRYKDLLEKASVTGSERLQKYATRAIYETIEEDGIEKFNHEQINLIKLREKYNY